MTALLERIQALVSRLWHGVNVAVVFLISIHRFWFRFRWNEESSAHQHVTHFENCESRIITPLSYRSLLELEES